MGNIVSEKAKGVEKFYGHITSCITLTISIIQRFALQKQKKTGWKKWMFFGGWFSHWRGENDKKTT